jgi:phospholipase C
MSTQQSAQVYVTNATDGYAEITLYHNNSTNGTQTGVWPNVPPGQHVGPLTVLFRTGFPDWGVLDYWAVELRVKSGSEPGVYQSSGFTSGSHWKECQLRAADAARDLPVTVDTGNLRINLPSGGCQAAMNRVAPYAVVSHVFVLMLENHSFDNMFAFSGIPGIIAATTSDSNSYNPNGTPITYPVGSPAPRSMPTDPGHEFPDTVEQLCGQGAAFRAGSPYPPITDSGFAANYATTTSEIVKPGNPRRPTAAEIGDIMKCFDTPGQLPVIHQLATEFALCDQWFSSLPGPTWPNRFFVHGASSAGWDDSPSSSKMAEWETPGFGFTYPNGSIFQALSKQGVNWKLYVDEDGPALGGIPQVAALKGIVWEVNTTPFSRFAADLQGPYPYGYTFIEPNYGDIYSGSYQGGSSQHPKDGVHRGEALIKATYEALRASPLWDSSLLIVTYDEHGGFYDSGKPGTATAPGDGSPTGPPANKHGFAFDHYGVRVPAVIVSPLIQKGVVDHTVYDHTSVLATVERLYDVPPLTNRDKNANDLIGLLSLPAPRTDCPTTLSSPAPAVAEAALPEAAEADLRAQPLPDSGNIVGFLGIMLKTDIELAGGSDVESKLARVDAIETLAEAEAYASEVYARAKAARQPPAA